MKVQAVLLTLLVALGGSTTADESEKGPRLDIGKRTIELPAKQVIPSPAATIEEARSPSRPVEFLPKAVIENPTKRVIGERLAPGPANSGNTRTGPSRVANPAVPPGKVHWHADLASAREAARRSGKPVLLFQLMGRLDRRFT